MGLKGKGIPLSERLFWEARMEKKEMKLDASRDRFISASVMVRNLCLRRVLGVALSEGSAARHLLRKDSQSEDILVLRVGDLSVISRFLRIAAVSPLNSDQGSLPVNISIIIHPNCHIS